MSTLIPSAAVGVHAQSTCDYFRQLPYLQSIATSIPAEPKRLLDTTIDASDNISALFLCHPNKSTCCTKAVEAEMARYASSELERAIQAQIQMLAEFFSAQSALFQRHTQEALTLTERQLAAMFRLTYGPYYADHSQVFVDFFDRIRQFLTPLNASASSVETHDDARRIFDVFLNDIYIAEFSVLNPTLRVGETERACMAAMRNELQPFGELPEKTGLLLTRGLNTWRVVINILNDASLIVKQLQKNITLSPACVRVVTQLRQCHLCAGEAPRLRPCLGYCVNVLRGCFAELVEISPQFEAFIDAFIRLSARLKGVHNPYGFLAPLPTQISEAIMNFQENGTIFSRRVQFRCFPSEFQFRVRRKASDETVQKRINCVSIDDKKTDRDSDVQVTRAEWFDLYAQSSEMADQFREYLLEFVDKLQRTHRFWTSISSTLCEDGGIAAARSRSRRTRNGNVFSEAERCWNGSASSVYRQPVIVADASLQQNAVLNPEYQTADRRLDTIPKCTFTETRRQFTALTSRLNACYEDRTLTDDELFAIKSNDFRQVVSEDDEDGSTEASGSNEFEDKEFEIPNDDSSSGTSGIASQGGKRYMTFRHPVSNLPVIVTRNLPASSTIRVTGVTITSLAAIALYSLLRITSQLLYFNS